MGALKMKRCAMGDVAMGFPIEFLIPRKVANVRIRSYSLSEKKLASLHIDFNCVRNLI